MAVDGTDSLCCDSPAAPYEEEGDDRSSERSSSPGRGGDSTASTTSSAPPTGVTSHNGTTGGEEAEPLSRMDSEDRDSLVVDCAAVEGRREGAWAVLDNNNLHNLGQPFIVNGHGLISISSTLMDVDSTISSGRSTPAMMISLGISTSTSKSIAYNCCWDQCQTCFSSSPDLAEHIRSIHVDGQRGGVFVCFWKGCKVYNTPSTSQSWLQRHMLTHSGDKPFKCVVGGCNASFASQGGLARHVPTHFSQQNSSKMSSHKSKEDSPSKAGLNKRRKLKNRRKRSLPRPHDFFDAQTLDAIRHRAICFNLSAQIESLGKGNSVVFHSTVIAKRKEDSGKVKLLLHWTPEDILPDVWVNETERHQLKTKVVHLSKLPRDTALLLDPNIYRNPSKRMAQSGSLKDHCSKESILSRATDAC